MSRCLHCHQGFAPEHPARLYCSKPCQRRAERQRWRQRRAEEELHPPTETPYELVCRYCEQPFRSPHPARRYCSSRCRAATWKLNRYPAVLRENADWLRRRRQLSKEGDEIVWILVAIRDDWRCHLCHERVQPWEVGQEGPSLDHVIPTSLGGLHVYENVRLAHRRCNTKKGEQLLLVSTY